MEQRRTKQFNTPCAASWDDAWIARVEECESQCGHAVCGARTLDGTPCTLPPNHANGRCRFHGGFDTTGAQPGNRNAVIHGLYSRGLQRCGSHCAQWAQCPYAGDDVEQLPLRNRPTCPYEATQYQMAFTDLEHRLHRLPCADHVHRHIAHQAALLQVMVARAAAALTRAGLTEAVTAHSGDYTMESPKPSAALTAFLRLSSEYRRYLALLDSDDRVALSFDQQCDDTRRRTHDAELTPEAQAQLDRTPPHGKGDAEQYVALAQREVGHVRYIEQTAREKANRRAKDLSIAELVERFAGHDCRSYDTHRAAAAAHYAKAFTLYPASRETLANDPNHDPALFPNPP